MSRAEREGREGRESREGCEGRESRESRRDCANRPGQRGREPDRPNLEVLARTLMELAGDDRDLIVVTSDSRGSGRLGPFAEAFPAQLVEVGIAEQNLVGVAAGLAASGKKVFAVSPASFLCARALEQIKNDVAYSDWPVTLVGISAGVSYGALGSTHHSLHDLAALRAIHNLTLVAPADNFEAEHAVRLAAAAPRPVYLRFGKGPLPHLHEPGDSFAFGDASTIRPGRDVAFIATGEAVAPARKAAEELAGEGIESRVLSMHTVKPLDREAVIAAGRECRAVVTVEEHHAHGGLSEACAATLLQAGVAVPFRIVAIPDEETVAGSQAEIFRHYGLSREGLAEAARKALES